MSQSAVHIGNVIDAKEAAGPLADAVIRVLEAISERRIDRETGLKALDVVAMASTPNATISHCTFGKMPKRGDWELYRPATYFSSDAEETA